MSRLGRVLTDINERIDFLLSHTLWRHSGFSLVYRLLKEHPYTVEYVYLKHVNVDIDTGCLYVVELDIEQLDLIVERHPVLSGRVVIDLTLPHHSTVYMRVFPAHNGSTLVLGD